MKIYQVDAFTDRPFTGNPAAVVLLEQEADAAWMQQVAAEMNLSETAFVTFPPPLPPPVSPQHHTKPPYNTIGNKVGGLRWFTPAVEVNLCGHATLAAAHVLWEAGWLERTEPARFETRSGTLTARLRADGWIELDFPAGPAAALDADDVRALGFDAQTMLNCEAVHVGRSAEDLLVEVADAQTVQTLKPDFARLAELPVRGIAVTAPASTETEADFVSRFFAPAVGIDEDPVTGSAHCMLGPWWADRLGRAGLVGHQLSQRGGTVRVNVKGDRVELAGRAVTVFEGELAV
ncbi:MAG: PhzF family phenazine biosynthesis protein [Phycisphaeraceae bacterium]